MKNSCVIDGHFCSLNPGLAVVVRRVLASVLACCAARTLHTTKACLRYGEDAAHY